MMIIGRIELLLATTLLLAGASTAMAQRFKQQCANLEGVSYCY
jgi:hypothetical protein